MKAKYEEDKFLVINRKYLLNIPSYKLDTIILALKFIEQIAPNNKYLVINQDEPYANKILDIILKGEDIKNVQD